MAREKKNTPVLEEAFAELEEIITKMEQENLALEESFDLFQEGMKLIKTCNGAISEIEKKILILEEPEKEGKEMS